jgi:Contractile injection system tube protein/LysM domain
MPLRELKTAYVEPINGSRQGERIEVFFNPADYSIEKGNTFQSTSLPGLATPVTQFVTGNADTLTMELFFDTYTMSLLRHPTVSPREDVRKYTRKLTSLLDVDPQLHAPPIVQFIWGPPLGSPEGFQFTAIIEKISQKFTFFLDDGTPVRATLSVTFKEYKTVEQQLQEIGRQSADRTTRKVFREGDSLWMLAAEEYNDPGRWRVIADSNGIENPRLIEPGTELELPPLA